MYKDRRLSYTIYMLLQSHLRKKDDNHGADAFTLHLYYAYALPYLSYAYGYGLWQVVAVLLYPDNGNAHLSTDVSTQ